MSTFYSQYQSLIFAQLSLFSVSLSQQQNSLPPQYSNINKYSTFSRYPYKYRHCIQTLLPTYQRMLLLWEFELYYNYSARLDVWQLTTKQWEKLIKNLNVLKNIENFQQLEFMDLDNNSSIQIHNFA